MYNKISVRKLVLTNGASTCTGGVVEAACQHSCECFVHSQQTHGTYVDMLHVIRKSSREGLILTVM